MAAPVVSSVSPSQGPASGGTTVTVTGSGFTGATAVRFGAASATSFTVVSSTQITAVSPPGNGPVNVTVTTSQGTSSQSVPFTYLTVAAPTLTSLTPTQGPVGTSVTLTGTNLTGATAVRFDGVAASSFTVDSATQVTAVAPAHSAGASAVTVTTAGGTSNSLTFTYLAVPALTGVSPAQGPVSGGTSVTLTGTNLTGATAVRFDGVAASSFTVDSATQVTAVAPAHSAGASAVTVTTAGGTSNSLTFTYLAVPALTGVSPAQGPVSGGTSVTLTGTNLTGATAVRFDGVAASSFTVDSATQVTAVAPAHSAGASAVTVTTAGGTSNSLTFTYLAVPALTGVSPAQGPVSGGTSVTLTGTNLTGATAVRFDGVAASSFTVDSATQVTAVAPAHSAGASVVTVTTAGGTSNSLTFTYLAVPALTGVSPAQGPVSGGTSVTLTGTNLTGATAVRFDGVAASSFTVDSATQITAVAPAHAAGAAAVTVTTPGGTSNPDNPQAYFFYAAVPSLTAVTPPSGTTAGGTTVTLTGTGLLGATAVRFDTVAATSFTVNSATQITAVAPVHAAGTAAVTVTTPGGTSNPVAYVYLASAVLASLVPDKGPTQPGTVVTVTGTNLTDTTGVQFGSTPVPFTVVSPTQLTAAAPAGTAGPVTVTVTTPAGSSNSLTYTRIASPGI